MSLGKELLRNSHTLIQLDHTTSPTRLSSRSVGVGLVRRGAAGCDISSMYTHE